MVHPLLREVFADLDAEHVRWCLLRMPSDPEAPTGDVDVLVDSGDLARLARVLEGHGFLAVPGWESLPTAFYLAYDRASAACLLLEVSDEVSFGRGLELRTGLAPQVLAATRVEDDARLPSAEDTFWLLLLHCLLDKGVVHPKYQSRLKELAAGATDVGPLAALVDAHAPSGWTAARVRTAAAGGAWDELDPVGRPFADAWRGTLSWTDRNRPRLARARRAVRAPSLLRRRYGVSVALLGPNGAGKSTLGTGIERAWPFPVERVYMGLWKSGDSPGREIPGVAQLMRLPTAWARYLRGTSAQLRGHLVVFDRYVHDARVPPSPPFVGLKRIYLGVLAHAVPGPDLVLLLNLPGAVSHARKPEDTLAAAEQEYEDYRRLAEQLRHVHEIDASASAEQVLAESLEAIWQRCRRRWGAAATGARGRDGAGRNPS